MTGRPSGFTEDIGDNICERLALGESLRSICRDKGMPSMSMIFRWLADDRYQIFREQYRAAREVGLESMADELMEIADKIPPSDDRGRIDNGAVQHQRLMVDARKWILSKQLPKKYGDRITTELTGADGGAIEIDDTERAAKIKAILMAAKARADGTKQH